MENNKNYKRPKITYTDTIQDKEEIKKQLSGFYDINFEEIKKGDIIKYIAYNIPKKKYLFRIGGIVSCKAFGKIKLKNSKNSYYWWVRPIVTDKKSENEYPTYFYRKFTREDELEERIEELEEENQYLKELVSKFMNQ